LPPGNVNKESRGGTCQGAKFREKGSENLSGRGVRKSGNYSGEGNKYEKQDEKSKERPRWVFTTVQRLSHEKR